jgi:thioredoxin
VPTAKIISDDWGGVMDVDDSNFQKEVIEKSKEIPVVADFWASWCMPCQILGPVLEKIAGDYNGKFVLAKVNIDEAREAATKYGIMSIPSVKLFKNGEVIDEFTGAQPDPKIREWLDKNL